MEHITIVNSKFKKNYIKIINFRVEKIKGVIFGGISPIKSAFSASARIFEVTNSAQFQQLQHFL